MNSLVFLDFDGVVTSKAWQKRARNDMVAEERLWNQVDPLAVRRLNRLAAAGAGFVVSSTWRIMNDVPALQKILDIAGFSGTVVDRTPVFQCFGDDYGLTGRFHPGWSCPDAHRGHEIQAWLDATYPTGVKPPFVILDDSADMRPHLDRLVRTTWSHGLLAHHVDAALQLLQS